MQYFSYHYQRYKLIVIIKPTTWNVTNYNNKWTRRYIGWKYYYSGRRHVSRATDHVFKPSEKKSVGFGTLMILIRYCNVIAILSPRQDWSLDSQFDFIVDYRLCVKGLCERGDLHAGNHNLASLGISME